MKRSCLSDRERRKRERQRVARLRKKLGIVVLPVEVDGSILDLMVRTKVATEAQVDACYSPKGRAELGAAVTKWFKHASYLS